jgi:hypothetical protein
MDVPDTNGQTNVCKRVGRTGAAGDISISLRQNRFSQPDDLLKTDKNFFDIRVYENVSAATKAEQKGVGREQGNEIGGARSKSTTRQPGVTAQDDRQDLEWIALYSSGVRANRPPDRDRSTILCAIADFQFRWDRLIFFCL